VPIVLFEPGGHTRRIADEWFARTGVTITPMMSVGSVEAIKEMAAAGLACAVLPGLAVRRPVDRIGLVVRRLSPRLFRRLAVVVRRDKPLGHGVGAMVRALKALSARPPARVG
jgi:DNA-binding transcriptional LysR family regulator